MQAESGKIITRFAPSPTGYLHIGGARTALFNHLFARAHGGRYLLRIEDTDKARSTDDAIAAIHDGLGWLGLGGDGEVVMQSERQARHKEVAAQLLESGAAYKCGFMGEELADMQKKARAEGKAFRSPHRNSDFDRDATFILRDNAPYSIRLRMPDSGTTTINDMVQGWVAVPNNMLDDLVLLRSDGTPTYMLAVVVDDHDMGITHVIRGDDHLNNAFRQQKIIEALGWQVPRYAHIPLIHGPDGAKLSKRHGALSVTEYRDMGFLADAVLNYLLRLGWSHGDDEIISRADAEKWFGLDAVGKSPARFDMQKLEHLNNHYLRAMPAQEIAAIMAGGDGDTPPHIMQRLTCLAPAFAERATRISDLREAAAFALHDNAPAIDDDASAMLTDEAKKNLAALADALPQDDFPDRDALKAWFDGWLESQELKMRDVGPALRAALTGKKQSPDILLIAHCLGMAQTRRRIAACHVP